MSSQPLLSSGDQRFLMLGADGLLDQGHRLLEPPTIRVPLGVPGPWMTTAINGEPEEKRTPWEARYWSRSLDSSGMVEPGELPMPVMSSKSTRMGWARVRLVSNETNNAHPARSILGDKLAWQALVYRCAKVAQAAIQREAFFAAKTLTKIMG